MPLSIYSRYAQVNVEEIDGEITLAQRALDPDPPVDGDSLLHVLVGGETLDSLAKVYYGNEELWWRIADANPTRFALEWLPGETLVIPPIVTATRVSIR